MERTIQVWRAGDRIGLTDSAGEVILNLDLQAAGDLASALIEATTVGTQPAKSDEVSRLP
jgi:hypothetical protein